jgi:hypothetical protein
MAGRMLGYSGATLLGQGFKPKLFNAYAEGRRQFPSAVNPFPANTDQNRAWQYGFDNRANANFKFETAT